MTKKEFIEVLDKYTELRNSHTLDRDLAGEKFDDVANELEKLGLFDVIEPLIIDPITVHPIDKDGHFEIGMYEEYTYLTTEEAEKLIDYLTKSINAR